MGQVTIYLDNETENKLKKAAKSSHLSVSKWIAGIIKEKIMTEWPQDVVELAGSWKEDFPTLEEIRSNIGHDSMREEL
ncbi:CopG family transcriptional regulator [Desulfobulbus sp. US1]|nr:CopG family transcriptional regulator [Desulfobulbus sp. US4]MCW5204899.1 CopG family transcriptional regulator [Desulfobulbus sp. N2]MCW5209405.1 CopG family transcriptional regulator [Desulfobulbus sp. US1]MCW5210784.1 CopG family transcriptional regulator [Desulfobulbus sp. N3]MCW5214639.1 CopG family transcriptional regulator [Desulfobulbus sp. US5]